MKKGKIETEAQVDLYIHYLEEAIFRVYFASSPASYARKNQMPRNQAYHTFWKSRQAVLGAYA